MPGITHFGPLTNMLPNISGIPRCQVYLTSAFYHSHYAPLSYTPPNIPGTSEFPRAGYYTLRVSNKYASKHSGNYGIPGCRVYHTSAFYHSHFAPILHSSQLPGIPKCRVLDTLGLQQTWFQTFSDFRNSRVMGISHFGLLSTTLHPSKTQSSQNSQIPRFPL